MISFALLKAIKKPRSLKDLDLISDLPESLIETILMKLQLRDAARTCILSKRWKDSWVKIPHLKLDASFWQESLQNQSQGRAAKFESILFRILLVHQGPITNITLHIPKLESPPDIDMFVTSIVRNGVQRFGLDNVGGHYKMHSSLFTCPTLNDLELRCCEVNFLPSTSERLSNLTTMQLIWVTISAQTLKCLVSSCQSLRVLLLIIPIDISYLEINSPKLHSFSYRYSSSSQSPISLNLGQPQQGGILKLLGGFPKLQHLYLDNHGVKSLAAFGLPTRLPTSMLHLKSILVFKICLEDVQQFSSVLCLIRSSPNLQKLKVYQNGSTVNNNDIMENLQNEEDYTDLTLNHLVDVEILFVVGGKLELKFIRILLEKSPSLRKMNISFATSEIDRLRIIEQMFMFRRAAPNVEVIIKEGADY